MHPSPCQIDKETTVTFSFSVRFPLVPQYRNTIRKGDYGIFHSGYSEAGTLGIALNGPHILLRYVATQPPCAERHPPQRAPYSGLLVLTRHTGFTEHLDAGEIKADNLCSRLHRSPSTALHPGLRQYLIILSGSSRKRILTL